jgi:hypothetical protein
MTAEGYNHPFSIAIEMKNVEIAAIILEYSRQPAKHLSPVEDGDVTELYTSAEWMNSGEWMESGDCDPLALLTAPMHAIREFDDNYLCRLFMIAGLEDINGKHYIGRTILLEAVRLKKGQLARLLMETYGADIEVQDKFGKTALDYAGQENSLLASTLENISEIRSSKLR